MSVGYKHKTIGLQGTVEERTMSDICLTEAKEAEMNRRKSQVRKMLVLKCSVATIPGSVLVRVCSFAQSHMN